MWPEDIHTDTNERGQAWNAVRSEPEEPKLHPPLSAGQRETPQGDFVVEADLTLVSGNVIGAIGWDEAADDSLRSGREE